MRYALRTLLKSRGLTAVIVLSLALGIGANTALFSVANALFLKPLPFADPDRLAVLWLRSPGIGIPLDWPSPGQYIDIVRENHSLSAVSISRGASFTLTGRGDPERIEGLRTSANLFSILGARPLHGRLLLPEEDAPGKPPVAVLSYAVWERLFRSDPKIVGQSITLNGNSLQVVGVLPRQFRLNRETMLTVSSNERLDVFVPLPLGSDAVTRRGDENYNLTARLKPGITPQQAQADIDVIAGRIREKDKRDRSFTISVVPLLDQVVGNVRRVLLVLFGSVALVLLIACANVANLLLSRAAGREKEIAVRTALGAGRWNLVRQLLTESLILGIAGGVGGLIIAELALRAVRVINPGNIPPLEEISMDAGVLAFTLVVSVLTGILFGLAPALRAARVDLITSLKSGGRSSQGAGGFNTSRHRLRAVLVVSQVAVSLMLLTGAGLLVRSFLRLQSVPPGFQADHVITMRASALGSRYSSPKPVIQFYQQVGERIAHLPGVVSQGSITALPLTSSVGWGGINVEGFTPAPGQELQVDMRMASSDYFQTMRIPLIAGRPFNDHDIEGAQRVTIIDEKFASRFWPKGDAVGKHLWNDPKEPVTIVGVVSSVKQYGLDVDGKVVTYYPDTQRAANTRYLVARTSGDPAALASSLVREIHAVDPGVAVYDVRPMESRLYDSVARQRFGSTMLAAFAGFALILAAVGVYGVMSFQVTQSSHDLGVRIALGARAGNILSLVVRQGMLLAAVGIVVGLAGAAMLTRTMASLLFGIGAHDALTYIGVSLFLAAVALAASYIPARRATRIDPLAALRDE